MDMYGINNESISDMGCRKLLGIASPASCYLRGIRYPEPLKKDSYMAQRARLKNLDKIEQQKTVKKTGILIAATAMLGSFVTKLYHNHILRKASQKDKVSFFSKIKTLFSKK